ncbi:MAG: lantibiotic dehydratase [Lachnospiraceae bacterium]|nr:lantibiotic dehydratase [Lachnospiraceae bacterium]
MKAECQDFYMIRTPNLPIEYFDKYEHQELDIYEFIRQDEELDSFFRKALLIASPTLYKSYVNKPVDEKKYKNLTESLLKYFLRSVGRPTPYGYFASVALGRFDESTSLLRGEQILDLRVDNNWINQIVSMLEQEDEIQGKLKVRYNPLCYISGDRVKNLYFTSHGKAEEEKRIIEEKSIRHTPLTDLLESVASDFVTLGELSERIQKSYKTIPEMVIEKTLNDMIENEFLISDLRVPAYCVDSMAYIIHKLDEMKYSGHYLFELKKIQELLEGYCKEEREEALKEIYEKMSAIKKDKNYLILNIGNQYVENTLDRSIQKKIEKLTEVLYKIPVDFDATHALKEKFMEVYGENVKVPIMQIIDSNRFDGGSLVDLSRIGTNGEEEVLHIIENKIQQAFMNQEKEICLFDTDFCDLQYKPVSVGSFDINLLIMDKNGEYDLWLGPNFGSDRAGSMAQRFSECFTEEEFAKYNQLYEKDEDIHSQYENVEIREFKTFGTLSNVLNTKRNCKYCLTLGTHSEDEDSEIKLDDIYIGLDDNGIYAWSKLLEKKLRFITDNMLNPMLNNKITRLLLGISKEYSSCPLSRLAYLPSQLQYKHFPRIRIEDIVVLPRMWMLDETDLSRDSYDRFKFRLEECRKIYKMDSILYYASADNRIIVNLDKEKFLHILYNEFIRKKELQFSEIEEGLIDGAIVKDYQKRNYINECVFSVLDIDQNRDSSEHYNWNSELCEIDRRKTFCESGWIYFKLYGIGHRGDEIISTGFPKLLGNLGYSEHFFLRYSDELGEHLRIRIKCKDEETAYMHLSVINKWIQELMDMEMINNVMFDTYFREINRYGGKELIDSCEQIFFKDSVTVEKLLRSNILDDEKELEKVYMIGISFILKNLAKDLDDMFYLIDAVGFQNKYRKEYRERSRQYVQYVQAVLDEKEGEYLDIMEEHIQEKRVLNSFAEKMDSQIAEGKNTNSRENIIFSIVHMYCNRLTGIRAYEEKYLELVRNTLYQIVQQRKHRNNSTGKSMR